MLGFAISFDPSVVGGFLSSTAFFTAADVVAAVASVLCTNVLLTQCTGYKVLPTTILHQSSCKGPKSMARNRTGIPVT